MQLQPIPRVLPSNAPPLQSAGHTDLQYASRVLQEHSGNRQLGLATSQQYAPCDLYENKYQPPVQTENAWRAPYQQYQQQATDPPQPYRRTYSYSHARQIYGYGHARPHDNETAVQRRADALYHHFQKSEGYAKYRSRQHKDDKNGQEQKWPDELERAFFQALVKFPPMGRRQLMHKGKRRGRNELIADYILQVTGVDRGRKQVSSHIQVLKPFVENDPYIMQTLSKHDHGRSPSRGLGAPGGVISGRRMSTYQPSGDGVTPYASTGSTQMTRIQTDLESVRRIKDKLELFQPNSFSMFVQRKIEQINGLPPMEERLHTYTQSIDLPLVDDVKFHDWYGSSQRLLAAMGERKPLDCNILVADASVGFPTSSFRDVSGVELGISFICSSAHLDPNTEVRCRNSFYRQGKRLSEEAFEAPFQFSEDRQSVTTSVKFGSSFWAKMLHQLASSLQKEAKDPARDAVAEVDSVLRELTAMLEVFVVSPQGNERVLIMCWTFRKSSMDQGHASWRRLVMPPAAPVAPSQYPELPRNPRASPAYEAEAQYVTAQTSDTLMQPALQSPFEYDSSSGSAPSSATWPTSISDGSLSAPPDHATFSAENSFDFNAGNINLSYDHAASLDPTLDFSNFDTNATFDSSTFDFEGTADVVHDPVLDQLSEQWWETAANSYDVQGGLPVEMAEAQYAPQAHMGSQTQAYHDFGNTGFEQEAYVQQSREQQAYGGAVEQDLATLAEASYLRSVLPKPCGS
ncbi:hypothetical protein LTR62_005502 [Meristemomyces frigidus]|uniref:TEA domain-containing protein n=1 Tax=Meristemomyces frigidus TaxID=1508187 RepID=A0AAN7TDC1_9PEZI|nr:hypothetical protein LTR62_005502 [Meristemomyces frigidus]